MKFSKIIVLILALACVVSVLASCDLGDITDKFDGGKSPETPKEYYEYAYNYMMTHAYKQTTVTTTKVNGEGTSSTSVSNMEGANYYIEDGGMKSLYYDGIIYVESAAGKKKMEINFLEMGESIGITENYLTGLNDTLTNDNITLTANEDGTKTLEFSWDFPVLGKCDYVFYLDTENHIVKYTMSYEVAVTEDYVLNTVYETTIEYGDQYKVNPPADPDSYETVDSYYDLVG